MIGSFESVHLPFSQTEAGLKSVQSVSAEQSRVHIHSPFSITISCKQVHMPTAASQTATPGHCSSIKHGPTSGAGGATVPQLH